MDLTPTSEQEAFRSELRSWLADHPPAEELRTHTEDLTNALSDARRAVEIAPARSPFTWVVYVLRGAIHHELRETEAAVADLQKAGGLAGPMAGPVNVLRNRWIRAPRPEK